MSDEPAVTERRDTKAEPSPTDPGLEPVPGVVGATEPMPTGRRPVLPPIAYPVVAILFGGALVWGFSRILLAVNKRDAAAIALLMALNILVGAAMVAYGGRVRRRPASFPLLVGAGVAVVVAGAVAMVSLGDRPQEGGPQGAPAIQAVALTVQGIKYLQTNLTLTSGGEVSMTFSNKDAGRPHNFVLFGGKDASAAMLFRGTPVTGPGSANYSFKAPGPGSYFFHCEFHPTTMTGTVTVTASAGNGTAGGQQLTARGLKFQPNRLKGTAGAPTTIHFVNQDPQTPHNVVVFRGSDASAPQAFRGTPVTGPGSADYSVTALPAGTYFFHCEFHPTTMTGTLVIT